MTEVIERQLYCIGEQIMKKTKMICTLGPASSNYETIAKLLRAGMNVARLNMSHGDISHHQKTLDLVLKARKELNIPCAIMVDTCGPEIRIGEFEDGKVLLNKGDLFTFCTDHTIGTDKYVSCPYPELTNILKPKQKIYANNGLLEFTVRKVENGNIVCVVNIGGELSNHKSISIPHTRLPLPFISKKDEENIRFAVKNDVEYISASFVNTPENVVEMQQLISSLGGRQQIISKIESVEGIKNLDKIIEVSDGIMVARGDMGTEVPIEHIPAIQKMMIEKCIKNGKKVIVATEMLESMTHRRRPTRAETTDVAQAIYDKTGATMLSGETASGLFPVESATTMSKIALATEKQVDYDKEFEAECGKTPLDAIAHSACDTAKSVHAKAIVCWTDCGKTACAISKFRPQANIVALTHDEWTKNSLALCWGIIPMVVEQQQSLDDLIAYASKVVIEQKLAKKGDKIVITFGVPNSNSTPTNSINICVVQ